MKNILVIIFSNFKKSLASICHFSPWIPNAHMLDCSILSHKSQCLCFFFGHFSSVCFIVYSLYWTIFKDNDPFFWSSLYSIKHIYYIFHFICYIFWLYIIFFISYIIFFLLLHTPLLYAEMSHILSHFTYIFLSFLKYFSPKFYI